MDTTVTQRTRTALKMLYMYILDFIFTHCQGNFFYLDRHDITEILKVALNTITPNP